MCIPVLAVFGLYRLFNDFEKSEEKNYALKWATIITGGLALIFILFKSLLFNFSGGNDSVYIDQLGAELVRALREDRKAIFTADAIRTLIFVILSAGLIWVYLKQKVGRDIVIGGFVILILVDLIGVDRRYVNNDDFVMARQMNQPFAPTPADDEIMQDEGHFRVFDLSGSPFNTGRTSYFHNSIGGYHAAKPGRIQDLYDFYISQNNMQVLNMLNVKYFIIPTEQGVQAQQNPEIFGNAWFVNNIKWAESADEEIISLGETNLKSTAIISDQFRDELQQFAEVDTTATIQLISHQPNELVYQYSSGTEQLAVFSEVYYPHGWTAYIDGNKTSHIQANYVLRAMMVPAGDHQITFKFEPEVIRKGSNIALMSSIFLGILLLGGIFYTFKKKE